MITTHVVKPPSEIGWRAAIPTEILIPGYQISDRIKRVIGRKKAGCRCQTCRILGVGQIIKLPDIFHRIVTMSFQFVENPPETDRRMIIVLPDQLAELLHAVLTKRRYVIESTIQITSGTDKRNFSPDNHAVTIHQRIKFIGLRIMSKSYGIGADFPNKSGILDMVFKQQCVATLSTILMTTHSAKPERLSIEDKAISRINLKPTQTERLFDTINHRPFAVHQFSYSRINKRIAPTIPQTRILNA